MPRQYEATAITRGFLTRLATHPAADDAAKTLLGRYFPDWEPGEEAVSDTLISADRLDGSFRDFLVSLSLDVAMADPDPEGRNTMLTVGAEIASLYDGVDAFKAALKRDLKLTRPAIDRIFAKLKKAKA